MSEPFDIFRVESPGVRWIECVATLEDAERKVRHFASHSGGEFFVLNQRTGSRFTVTHEGVSEASRAQAHGGRPEWKLWGAFNMGK
jgi:hypothetical protein